MTASATEKKGSALIVGAGPGLGRALADTFAAADRELDAGAWADAFAVNATGAAVAADAAISASPGTTRSVLFTGGGFALEPSMEYTSLSAGKAVDT